MSTFNTHAYKALNALLVFTPTNLFTIRFSTSSDLGFLLYASSSISSTSKSSAPAMPEKRIVCVDGKMRLFFLPRNVLKMAADVVSKTCAAHVPAVTLRYISAD